MYQIIKPTPDDFDELTCLWEASVRATHHFIPEAYIQKLKPLVWSVYLHSMPLYMIRDNAGIEGFMGINGTMLEMLFVHPRAIGTGIGKPGRIYAGKLETLGLPHQLEHIEAPVRFIPSKQAGLSV